MIVELVGEFLGILSLCPSDELVRIHLETF